MTEPANNTPPSVLIECDQCDGTGKPTSPSESSGGVCFKCWGFGEVPTEYGKSVWDTFVEMMKLRMDFVKALQEQNP